MKKAILITILSLFTLGIFSQTLDTIIYNGDSDEHINVVILGDAYTSANHAANKLNTDATNFVNALLNESPYSEYADFYNFFIIKRNSVQSGTDHPGIATDVIEPLSPVQTRNTYYQTTFDVDSIHRLLAPMGTGITNAYTDLANVFPNYDQIIMLVNDTEYGGSGGTIATSSVNASANEIAIHEMGHSYADLADEYYAGDQFAGERANMTANNNPATVKWKDWLNILGIGIYQHTCSSGNCSSWYKPHNNCKMQFLGSDFCSVCKEAIIDKMYSLADPFENKIPNLTSLFSFNGNCTTFGSNLILTNPNTYTIEWELNGNIIPSRTEETEVWKYEDFDFGTNVLKLQILDETSLSKSYLPDDGYFFELSWVVNKVDLCSKTVDKFDYVNSFPSGSSAGQTTADDFDWTEWVGSTPTSNTGPSSAYDGTTYLYTEACCSNIPNKKAIYFTDCFDLTRVNNPKMSLAIHMLGKDIGKLEIAVSDAGGNTNSYTVLQTFTGEIGPDWKEFEWDLSPFVSPYTKFQFTVTTGSGIEGDIAIDYLRVFSGCASSLTLNQTHTGVNTYEAQSTITSTSNVLSGSTIYRAGSSVNLNGGFNVNAGATFITQQGGCN